MLLSEHKGIAVLNRKEFELHCARLVLGVELSVKVAELLGLNEVAFL